MAEVSQQSMIIVCISVISCLIQIMQMYTIREKWLKALSSYLYLHNRLIKLISYQYCEFCSDVVKREHILERDFSKFFESFKARFLECIPSFFYKENVIQILVHEQKINLMKISKLR